MKHPSLVTIVFFSLGMLLNFSFASLSNLESFSKSQLKMVNKSLKNKRNTKSEIDYYKNQKNIRKMVSLLFPKDMVYLV